MKRLALIFVLLAVAGCASRQKEDPQTGYPLVPITVEPKAQQMSRNEVINAIIECETNNTRAVPIISKRMVSGMMSDIIIDVQCMPKRYGWWEAERR